MKKIVVNRCYGGFGLSGQAINSYLKLKGIACYFYIQTKHKYTDNIDQFEKVDIEKDNLSMVVHAIKKDLGQTTTDYKGINDNYFSLYNIDRDDPDLVKVVEELKELANGRFSELEIVEIPENINWEIDEYDGMETIEEVHRSW